MLPGTDIVAAMLIFASHASGLAIPQGRFPVIETAATPTLVNEHWQAYTNWDNQHVYLTGGWLPDSLGVCTLAHELTHWLQMQNGQPWTSDTSVVEPQAYTVGALCFDTQHDDFMARWSRKRAAFCSTHKAC